ncbi:uncharacterized protein LOC142766081, partial [Rhipicephalus microplus]|uniref:uncharacterized protein LOC142766081 n=1 Tax=Rhipicephalus microplus TaxID=6941 RepID=UPI003F6D921F
YLSNITYFLCAALGSIVHQASTDAGKPHRARRYKCNYCNYETDRCLDLTRHIRVHTDERPFQCHLCPQSFKQKPALKHHLRVHTGERPFKCRHCSQSFKQRNALTAHLRIHTGDRPYKCCYCSKSFSQLGTLNNHLPIHTGYKCQLCPQIFPKKSELKGPNNGCAFGAMAGGHRKFRSAHAFGKGRKRRLRARTLSPARPSAAENSEEAGCASAITAAAPAIADTIAASQYHTRAVRFDTPLVSDAEKVAIECRVRDVLQDISSKSATKRKRSFFRDSDGAATPGTPLAVVSLELINELLQCIKCGVFGGPGGISKEDREYGIAAKLVLTCDECASTDASPQHSHCPTGEESWCKYNKAVAKQETPPNHRYNLPEYVVDALRPIYTCLSDKKLLEHCQYSSNLSYFLSAASGSSVHPAAAHVKKSHRARRYQCNYCNYENDIRADLTRHIRVHTGERPFQCHLCPQRFKRKHALKDHLRFHTGERPFKCQYCSQRFKRKQTMIIHMHTHTGDRPFQCHHCFRSFAQQSYLNKHLPIHTGHKCEVCPLIFTKKAELKEHMRIHRGDLPHQ